MLNASAIRAIRSMRTNCGGYHSMRNRIEWGRGIFGALSRYYCKCGPVWDDPHVSCNNRGSRWSEPDWVWQCENCGSTQYIDERVKSDPRPGFTVINRRRVPAAHRPNRAER